MSELCYNRVSVKKEKRKKKTEKNAKGERRGEGVLTRRVPTKALVHNRNVPPNQTFTCILNIFKQPKEQKISTKDYIFLSARNEDLQ